MKITHFANSFLNINVEKSNLLCDPWIGTTKENAWISDPIHFNGARIVNKINPNFIYISHLHCDHFDPKLLKKITNKNVPIIIKKFKIPVLKNRIKKLGFKKIFEIKEWTVKKLNKDISVVIVPQITNNNEGIDSSIDYDLDTSIIIKSNKSKKIFYNNVDNPISLAHINKIKKFTKNKMNAGIDICTFNVGAASEYPQCFLNINRKLEKKKVIDKSFNNALKKIDVLGANFFFPSGGSYKVSGKFYNLNKFVALPKEKEFKQINNKKFKYVSLIGGKTLKVNGRDFKIDENTLNFSINENKIKKIKYIYEAKKTQPKLNVIDNLYKNSLKNYFRIIQKFKVKHSWNINFFIFKDIKLDNQAKIDYKKSKLIKKYTLKYSNTGKKYILDVFLDSKLFYQLISKKISWNTALSGSLILFKRKPNIFIPDLPFSLNFLTK